MINKFTPENRGGKGRTVNLVRKGVELRDELKVKEIGKVFGVQAETISNWIKGKELRSKSVGDVIEKVKDNKVEVVSKEKNWSGRGLV